MPFNRFLKKIKGRTSSPRPDAQSPDRVRVSGGVTPSLPDHADTQSDGLHFLNKKATSSHESGSKYPVDIVFVHGLNGHWAQTWTHENGIFWPQDLLPRTLPGARIFSYGYPSAIFANKSVAGIRDFAKHLLDDLGIARTEHLRPIVYVCHSLGGIVVKQALITARQQNEFRDVWSHSKAVVFMATPHRGSPYAAYAKVLGDIANVITHISFAHRHTGAINTALIGTLLQENRELQGISEDFYSIIQESTIQVISFYETKAHPLTNKTIVEKSSSFLGVRGEQFLPLFLNHQNICRFSGPDDLNYIKVSGIIKSEAIKEPCEQKTVASSLYTDYSYDATEKACVLLLNTIDIADYESKMDSRVEGTLEWFLRKPQYRDWTSNPDVRLLWVTGYFGCGKTILASFISRYLSELYTRALICRFFCDEKIEEHRSPQALLRSLIFQIVNKRRRLWRFVKKASDAGGFHIFSQFDALWNLFVQIAYAEKKYPITIIIDGIDEFDQGDQFKLVTRISKLLSLGDSTLVKFFITSRPRVEAAIDIQICAPQLLQLSLEENKEEIDSDIRTVIHHRLERMVKRGACKPFVRENLERMLIAKADQTFLWIKLVLPLLEDRRFLLLSDAEMIVNPLPITLKSLYRHLLSSIPEGDQATAARVLRLLVVCDRPLTGDEIGIMLTITSGHRSASSLTANYLLFGEESVQALLGPLVRVHASHVELVHLSLNEYLIDLSSGIQDSLAATFGVNLIRDKLGVFEACSMYLSLEEFGENIYTTLDSTEDDFFSDEEPTSSRPSSPLGLDLFDEQIFKEDDFADETTWAAVNAKYKLFDYAALHWAIDFAKCNEMATEQHNLAALSLCKADTAQLTNWFRYFWHKQSYSEPFPAVLDKLTVVSYFGHVRNMLHLLHGPDPTDPESLSRALYWTARQGHPSCVQLLLQQPNCKPQTSPTNGQIPLFAAAQFGHLDCVSLLLRDSRVSVNTQDNSGRTALYLAVANNHIEIVTELLADETIDVNLPDKRLNTPLHMAVDLASDSIVGQLLTDKRAKIDQRDSRGRNILSWAAELGAAESVSLILSTRRIPVNEKDLAGRTPLSYASQHGHLLVVKKLIETGLADPLGKDDNDRNAHSWAAMHRSSDVLRYLTKRFPQGADVPDRDGWTPLAWALDPPGYPENMLLLIRHGHVNVNQKDSIQGRSVLSWVATYGYTQIASELIQVTGVNLEARDVNGRTPLSEAAGSGSLEIVQLLIATDRVDINSRDLRSQTPLSWAARGGHDEVVILLSSCPTIDLDVQNSDGETALDIARRLGRDGIISVLGSWRES